MCFKNGKQCHINNCLDYKLINWSLGSLYTYVKSNLSNIKEITDTQLKFCHKKYIFLT